MSYKTAARVKETTTTTGTVTLQLAGAVADYQSFVAGIGSTNQCSYSIFEPGTGAWERGIGTVTAGAPDTLTRDIVLESTNGGAKVNLAAGTKDVFVDFDPQVYGGPFVDAIAKSANYTVTVADSGALIEVTTGGADVTISLLPLANVWRGFTVTVRKVDTGAGKVIVDGDGAEQIDGYATRKLWSRFDEAQVIKGSAASWTCRAKIRDRIIDITATGANTWTKEDGLLYVDAIVQAAGGAGGGADDTAAGEQSNGGGGGGGGLSRKRIAAAALGATETVTVGSGGTGVSASAGNNGGSSSFGAHCSATGGLGGNTVAASSNGNSASGGVGGVGSGGDENLTGQGGGAGIPGLGGPSARCSGGQGGSAPMGGGGAVGLGNGSSGGNGAAGALYGGGGNGACSSEAAGVNRTGGAGAHGKVRVVEVYA